MIKDSGDRRTFESGAVRDMRTGKGRCDLLPMSVITRLIPVAESYDCLISHISSFQITGDVQHLLQAAHDFITLAYNADRNTAILQLAIHFEEGAVKYGDNNWRKGIPANVYIDSAVRHYLKWLRGDTDEPHDRAVLWNLICCIWTCENIPELNTYKKTEE